MPTVKICDCCNTENGDSAIFCTCCGDALINVKAIDTGTSNQVDISGLSDSPQPIPSVASAQGAKESTSTEPACRHRQASDSTHCVYCDEDVFGLAGTENSSSYALRWPWGETTPIRGRLLIGRVPPVPDALARHLEQEYPNVSRVHAEIRLGEGCIFVYDHHSMNGTFLDGKRISAGQDVTVPLGASLLFSSRLEATLVITGMGETV